MNPGQPTFDEFLALHEDAGGHIVPDDEDVAFFRAAKDKGGSQLWRLAQARTLLRLRDQWQQQTND